MKESKFRGGKNGNKDDYHIMKKIITSLFILFLLNLYNHGHSGEDPEISPRTQEDKHTKQSKATENNKAVENKKEGEKKEKNKD